jgi:hypothetical protein
MFEQGRIGQLCGCYAFGQARCACRWAVRRAECRSTTGTVVGETRLQLHRQRHSGHTAMKQRSRVNSLMCGKRVRRRNGMAPSGCSRAEIGSRSAHGHDEVMKASKETGAVLTTGQDALSWDWRRPSRGLARVNIEVERGRKSRRITIRLHSTLESALPLSGPQCRQGCTGDGWSGCVQLNSSERAPRQKKRVEGKKSAWGRGP